MKTALGSISCGQKELFLCTTLGSIFTSVIACSVHRTKQDVKVKEARIEGASAEDDARFFRELEGPSKAVLEACWNWGLTHDLVEEIDGIEEV